MKRWVGLLLFVVLSGCTARSAPPAAPAAPPPTAPAPGPVPAAEVPAPAAPGAPSVFDRYPGKVAAYTVQADLVNIANAADVDSALKLSPAQKKLIEANLFVVTPTAYKQLFQVYENNEYLNLPSFVSADLVLQLYHILYDFTMRTVETETLYPALTRLTAGMLELSKGTLLQTRTPRARRAALKNVAYFAVASLALGVRPTVPADAARMAQDELKLISEHAGFAEGAVFPYKIDYSQFVPRGHYTRSERLRRFFMGMLWYGLAPFATRTADGRRTDEQIVQGLLLARDLHRGQLDKDWDRVYGPTSFFVGKADDHTPGQWYGAMTPVYGDTPGPDALADAGKLPAFLARLDRLPRPRIAADLVLQERVPHPQQQLRFMGQRYLPDSEVLQRLSRPVIRPVPAGLDVMAALGSTRATELLDGNPKVFNPLNWPEYAAERTKIVAEFAGIGPAVWGSTLYWRWLDALRALLAAVPEGYPAFMRQPAWQDRSLMTALASWAELRHDTILYGKQSVSECGDGEERPIPRGYVEPNIPFWDRMLVTLRRTRDGLSTRALLPERIKGRMEEFENLLVLLKTASEKELRNEELSEREYLELRYLGGRIERMTLSVMDGKADQWSLVNEADRDMAVIADVHTAPPVVLEEGVGRANEILVVVPIGGKLYLTRGAVFSYHEFNHSQSDRLTDERWQSLLKAGKAPEAPFWTKPFTAPARKPVKGSEQLEVYAAGC